MAQKIKNFYVKFWLVCFLFSVLFNCLILMLISVCQGNTLVQVFTRFTHCTLFLLFTIRLDLQVRCTIYFRSSCPHVHSALVLVLIFICQGTFLWRFLYSFLCCIFAVFSSYWSLFAVVLDLSFCFRLVSIILTVSSEFTFCTTSYFLYLNFF